jgi:hypothetical protein
VCVLLSNRVYSDPIENKGSCFAGLRAAGVHDDVQPPTYWTFGDWMADAYPEWDSSKEMMPRSPAEGGPVPAPSMSTEGTLWFIKHVHGTNSKDIECCVSVRDGTMSLVAGALKQKCIMGDAVDNSETWEGMAQRLAEAGNADSRHSNADSRHSNADSRHVNADSRCSNADSLCRNAISISLS